MSLECANSKQCAPYKHHFDECVERVTEAQEHAGDNKGPHEDCVEECKWSSLPHPIFRSLIETTSNMILTMVHCSSLPPRSLR
jgi:hypothetical protein